jgi:hypothetical protein
MNVVQEVDGQTRKKKVVEVVEDSTFDGSAPVRGDSMQAPVMQFEAAMVDDLTANGAKKKKKKKKKAARAADGGEEEENLASQY